ncbi:MAG: BlaI/MecI/CopY family transcriptional regulator [Armatimonadetes bacterium]|nr:BlaI/MecI/CopY family transcriptional regulator [Armatimonadota bacterium]
MTEMKDLPPAEFQIMEVLWQKGEATVKEVHAELSKRKQVAYNTIGTVLTRLRQKGVVDAYERNFAWVFRPLISREDAVHKKLDNLVKLAFNGSVAELAAFMVKKRKLTEKEVAMLEAVLGAEEVEAKH